MTDAELAVRAAKWLMDPQNGTPYAVPGGKVRILNCSADHPDQPEGYWLATIIGRNGYAVVTHRFILDTARIHGWREIDNP